jgi:acyl-CoA-binding protein
VSNTDKLEIYSLFKQITLGDAPEKCERSGYVEQTKFNKWESQVGKSWREATQEYILLVAKISDVFDL